MLKNSFLVSFILLLSGCTKYVLYEVPYCLESVKIPRPTRITFEEQINLTDIPCNSVECDEFIVNYQQKEIKQLEMISNYVGESQLRFDQYERRVDQCIEANNKVRDIISGKVEEEGRDNVEVVKLDLGE